MSAVTAVLAGRRAAEMLMADSCVITREGPATTDDLTGEVTSSPTTVYSGTGPGGGGKCKIQHAAAMGQRVDAGEASTVLLRVELHLPVVGSENVRRGDLVTMTASAEDSALVGNVYRVHDEAGKSFATARRLGVEEVT